ncbi:hypothetical protein DFO70_104138 [Cytobacillus firmus]|uniref:Uncharacterized protein n=2 Tax=Cytobacillus TaxID=2675230 RepID=A0A366K020_CYTFI|nr:hypothetical protein DFO70_104138 [Cytobacillus firmus]TDX43245.1 hypothetical protein DFO72_105141 [Cytobacillus oceanisediminis]
MEVINSNYRGLDKIVEATVLSDDHGDSEKGLFFNDSLKNSLLNSEQDNLLEQIEYS